RFQFRPGTSGASAPIQRGALETALARRAVSPLFVRQSNLQRVRYLHSIGYSRSFPPVGMLWRASDGPEQHIRRGCPASGPGSPSHGSTVTARRRRTSFLAEKEAFTVKRMLTAFWDEDRQEVQVRRPTG